MTKARTRFGGLLAVICVLALMVTGATPAFAHHKEDHSQGSEDRSSEGERFGDESSGGDHDGDADNDSSSTQTEDDPDPRENDPEDQADEGDNQHPSGKDRSVENGNSSSNPNQGKAESNPDDSKGPQRFEGGRGDDKPNGPGGVDAADQDGNNGCGNDDDFDDDNNGHCGPRVRPTPTPSPTPTPTFTPTAGSALMTINVDCFSVTVTSSKDISNVVVRFADGSVVKFEGLKGHSWSATFAKAITSASAKSATTVVTDTVTENCVSVLSTSCPYNPSLPMGHKDCVPPPPVCPGKSGMPLGHPDCNPILQPQGPCDRDATMPGIQPCEVSPTFELCPADTENAGFPMTDIKDCNKDDVLGRVDTVNPVEVCPSGPFKGMPMTSPRDCAAAVASAGDSVLPRFVVNSAEAVRGATRRAAGAVGAVLPFTGAGDALLLVGAALALIGSGALALRVRRND